MMCRLSQNVSALCRVARRWSIAAIALLIAVEENDSGAQRPAAAMTADGKSFARGIWLK